MKTWGLVLGTKITIKNNTTHQSRLHRRRLETGDWGLTTDD
jgi:hypothetical protein